MILGIDAGNHEVKVAGPNGLDRFSSTIGEYRERNLNDVHGKDDIVFEYEGRKGFAGTLADAESEWGGSIMGDSKAHEDAKLRILIALHRYARMNNTFDIIVGQPIGKHNAVEKETIKNMLRGSHEIIINGERRLFTIRRAEVAAEGVAAFWSKPTNGLVRVIDVGSGTINCASLRNKRNIDKESFTITLGMNTVISSNPAEIARGIATQTSKKWKPNDFVYVVGGAASELTPYIQQFYPQATEVTPVFSGEQHHAVFANAIGFYTIGRGIYGN